MRPRRASSRPSGENAAGAPREHGEQEAHLVLDQFVAIDRGALDVRRIAIGMIGHGFMGAAHANAFQKLPGAFPDLRAWPDLVAICGRDSARVADVALRFGFGGYYKDWRALIGDPRIEIVDVVTPDDRHRDPVIAAAAAGRHVICEKPLAMTVTDAAAMLEAVERAGVKHLCCFSYRFLPAVRLARELVASGALGRIYHFRGRYLQQPGRDPSTPVEDIWYATGTASGVLLGIGSHIIDMARFLVGEIASVSGLTRTYTPTRPDRSGALRPVTADEGNMALLEFASGATGTIESSGVATGRQNGQTWEISGSLGSLWWDLEDPHHLHVWTEADGGIRGFTNVSVSDQGSPHQVVYLPPGHNWGWEYGHVYALRHFVECVAMDRPVGPEGATFEDGYRAQVTMEAIVASSRTGRRINLKY